MATQPQFRQVSLQLSDPTVGVARAGQLFDNAIQNLSNIGTQQTESLNKEKTKSKNLAKDKILNEISQETDIDKLDMKMKETLASLNPEEVDSGAIRQAFQEQASFLREKRNSDQDSILKGEQVVSKQLAQQDSRLGIAMKGQELVYAPVLQDLAKKQAKAELAHANTQTKKSQLELEESELQVRTYTQLSHNLGAKPFDTSSPEAFNKSVDAFREEQTNKGHRADLVAGFLEAGGYINTKGTGSKRGLAPLISAINTEMKGYDTEIKSLESQIGAKTKGTGGYAQLAEHLSQFIDPTDTEPLTPGVLAGSEIMPGIQSIISDLNAGRTSTEIRYTGEDAYNAIISGNAGFTEESTFSGNPLHLFLGKDGHFKRDKLKQAIKDAGTRRESEIKKLREEVKSLRNIRKTKAKELSDYTYQEYGIKR